MFKRLIFCPVTREMCKESDGTSCLEVNAPLSSLGGCPLLVKSFKGVDE